MMTSTKRSTRTGDIGRAVLRSAAVTAALMSLLTAVPTGVVAADPLPVDQPVVTTGDPPVLSPGPPLDSPLPADDPEPSGDSPGPTADSPAQPAAAPRGGGGGGVPVSPVHRRPISTVSAQTTVIHLTRRPVDPAPSAQPPDAEPTDADPTPPPADVLPAIPDEPTPAKAPEVREVSLTRPAVLEMRLSDTTINPGGRVTATGSGCGPTAPVGLSVDHSPVGTTAADPGGGFTLVLDTTALAVGRHDVTADCGGAKNVALNVVLVSRVGTGAATSTLILILLLSGLWYFGHAILSPTNVRNRNA